MNSDLFYMGCAIAEARTGIQLKHGGPFGAVVVAPDGTVVGHGHNRVLVNNDPTCHGEIEAIRDACKNLGTFDLSGCVLYTTAQCCPMCFAACLWANIEKIYYGCTIEDTNNIGFRDEIMNNYLSVKRKYSYEQEVCRNDCLELFDDYVKDEHSLY